MKNNRNKGLNVIIIVIICALIVVGIGLLIASIWCCSTAQNIMIGLGSGLITSAVITFLFEIRSLYEKKNYATQMFNSLLRELENIISLFAFYFFFFIDESDEQQSFADILISKRMQLKEYLNMNDNGDKDVKYNSIFEHISISICERTEIKKCIDRAYELSALFFSTQAINATQYNDVISLYRDFYKIMEGMTHRENIAIEAFCFFLLDIKNLLSDFKELNYFNNLVFKGGKEKNIRINNKDKLTKQQLVCLNIVTSEG